MFVQTNTVVARSILYSIVSVVAANDADYDKWVKGLTYLVDDTARSSYSLMVLR